MSATALTAELLAGLMPDGAVVRLWTPELGETLDPAEEVAVARAVPERRQEFARGRAAARAALADLGVAATAIPAGDAREPLWPAGFVGSITHCTGLVAAVVAEATRVSAIGLDVEVVSALHADVRDLVVHPAEEARLDPALEPVVFSAKEAVHKAVFPQQRIWMDFMDVVVHIDAGRGSWTAAPAPEATGVAEGLALLVGRFLLAGDHVAAVCHAPDGRPLAAGR